MTDKIPFHPGKRRTVHMLREFLRLESAGGILLVIAAVAAMIVANSPLGPLYHAVLNDWHLALGFLNYGTDGQYVIEESILHWINDGLMVIFFFLVGLEIKREFKEGQLSSRDRALLPLLAAVGGMAVPALIFFGFTYDRPDLMRGWAIPSATDIAFTLGVLALLGSRVPLSVKILATAIAVIDDLGAIIIIAVFYAGDLYTPALMVAGVATLVLIAMNIKNVTRPAAYILVGAVLWVAVLESGIHATLAGVITALCVPMREGGKGGRSPIDGLIHALHPWVAFMILPIFAFANAGIPLAGITLATLKDPLVLGIALGLFVGKQVGIFGIVYAAIKTGLCPKPDGATWVQLYGMSILCGIGFTMSLFIGGLAYTSTALQVEVRLGVILGSILSAAVGYAVLRRAK